MVHGSPIAKMAIPIEVEIHRLDRQRTQINCASSFTTAGRAFLSTGIREVPHD
jgi:hypothetical protein